MTVFSILPVFSYRYFNLPGNQITSVILTGIFFLICLCISGKPAAMLAHQQQQQRQQQQQQQSLLQLQQQAQRAAALPAAAAPQRGEHEKAPPAKRGRKEENAEGNAAPPAKKKYDKGKKMPSVNMDEVMQQCGLREEEEADRQVDVCANLGLSENDANSDSEAE